MSTHLCLGWYIQRYAACWDMCVVTNYLSLLCCAVCECLYVWFKVEQWLSCSSLFTLLGSLWNGLSTFNMGRILYSILQLNESPRYPCSRGCHDTFYCSLQNPSCYLGVLLNCCSVLHIVTCPLLISFFIKWKLSGYNFFFNQRFIITFIHGIVIFASAQFKWYFSWLVDN
jgi:hypothetical protein